MKFILVVMATEATKAEWIKFEVKVAVVLTTRACISRLLTILTCQTLPSIAFSLVIYEYKKEALAPFKYNRETENAKTIAILLKNLGNPDVKSFRVNKQTAINITTN